ncbi:superoxide dismutase family protein [Paenibacillus silviterrae]|uniref:superoxide dismutase family protein n=1 Tax=Paenibacillus silviterrae TaxID=3242194 RepID=UPI002542E706|nr:superoxide dismutase family protein [Paenibacillus chinjuensis]
MLSKLKRFEKLAIGFLGGALFFSGLSHAASTTNLEVSLDRLQFFVQGEDKTSAEGKYDNGGTQVPEAIVYEGTTYIPLRKAADLLGESVYWDGLTRGVSIGKPYVIVYDGKGNRIGEAVLTPYAGGVNVALKVSNLTPGKHGVHIHEKAFTGFDFTTAGGHFNPDNKKHGHHSKEGHHIGDLDNIEVSEDGKGRLEFDLEGASLDKNSKFSLIGRSIIVHAAEDDGKTDPSGNSGDRVAGGIIPQ